MTRPVLGIDVSKYQPPAKMRWARLRELGYSFVYVRGVSMGKSLDVTAFDHVRNARSAGFRVGLYSFFHPDQPVEQQIALAREAHRVCGMLPGDLAPALDVESLTNGPQARPSWVAPAVTILEALTEEHGAAVRYHNVSDWITMGRPASLERWPLWLADYTPPADLPCVIWQRRSASINPYGSEKLDQNAALGELPTIGHEEDAVEAVEPSALEPSLSVPWPRFDHDEHSRLRNLAIARETEEGRYG